MVMCLSACYKRLLYPKCITTILYTKPKYIVIYSVMQIGISYFCKYSINNNYNIPYTLVLCNEHFLYYNAPVFF